MNFSSEKERGIAIKAKKDNKNLFKSQCDVGGWPDLD